MFRTLLAVSLLCAVVTGPGIHPADGATLPSPESSTQLSSNDTRILRGLKTVSVRIAPLDDWMVAHKISSDVLKTQAAQRIDAAGLTVVKEPAEKPISKTIETPPGVPVLYIRFKSIAESSAADFGAYTAQLSLIDSVLTKRDAHEILVAVWDRTDVGNLKPNMADELTWALNRQLDSFLTDWKSANNR